MSATSVEQLKQKVDKLIAAFELNITELEHLKKENDSLKDQIRLMQDKSDKADQGEQNTRLLKKKVEELIREVNECIELAGE